MLSNRHAYTHKHAYAAQEMLVAVVPVCECVFLLPALPLTFAVMIKV